ncbi:MAG: transposase [Microcoleus sp.]
MSKTQIKVPQLHRNTCEVRIVPKLDHYVIEVVYEQEETQHELNPKWSAAIDIGIDNLAALTSNKPGFIPVIVNGRPLKSINQYYNKQKAHLQSLLKESCTSKRIQRLSTQRNFKIDDYLHKASRLVIDLILPHQISTLIIGKNPLWKESINIGKVNNQKFVSIPHAKWVEQLISQAALVGITVVVTEESYTSKSDFLMLDTIPVYGTQAAKKAKLSGKRSQTKLYVSGTGQALNADVNGSYNIMRQVIPTAFSLGIEGVVVRQLRGNSLQTKHI